MMKGVLDCTDRELRTGSVCPESPAPSPSAPARNPPSSDEEPEGSLRRHVKQSRANHPRVHKSKLTEPSAASSSAFVILLSLESDTYPIVLQRVESETGVLTRPSVENRCDPVSGVRQTYPYKLELEGRSAINHRLIGPGLRHATTDRQVCKHTI